MPAATSNLLIKPDHTKQTYITVSPESAGWEHLHFSATRLTKGQQWSFETGEFELALIVLGGKCSVSTRQQTWQELGSREDVFHGMPTALYLSKNTHLTVTALSDALDFACGWAKAENERPAVLVKPEDVMIEIRGGENATRQINKMLPPGFACDRLVAVEVYTPSGNWSSYPPHKHDQRIVDTDGNLLEADLEEIYFYKIDRPEGFAYQRIYTDDRSLDELILVGNDQLVLSPEGYHPVVSAPGYNTYYLNFLAGSDQSLAATDDPLYTWVKDTWKEKDKRLPLVTIQMNK